MSSLENGMIVNGPYSDEDGTPIPDTEPVCPVCGEECAIYYMNELEIVGCENCVRRLSAKDNQWATVY